jgi:hypothetical protein
MGFRFRRSIRILPGIRLNIGKRGVSTSIGVRGARVTIGHGQTRSTVGIPGSGLSFTHISKPHSTAAEALGEAQPATDTDYSRRVGRGEAGCGLRRWWRSPRTSFGE